MVHFPVRKCYHVAKTSLAIVLAVTLIGLFEYWRGGRLGSAASFLQPADVVYEQQIQEDEARIVPGLGEGGVAAHLTGEERLLGQDSEKRLAMNVYLSDRIAYNRTLEDRRNPACKRVVYDAELPSASVVIIFHNEPYSVVLRTIWSVVGSARRDNPWFRQANYLDRASGRTMKLGYPGQDPASPLVYLKEIILVDDNSTLPELRGKLSHYVRTRLPPGLVKIVRLPDRVGLTRARLAGARYATGDVIIFLDSHCEGQVDWLRPLLQRIKDSPHAVVMPIIDVIEASDFYYSVIDQNTFQVGGFNFMGHFTWIDVSEREKRRRGSDIAPTWSPTMAGGLFAISRPYYWELGGYDEQMAGWGGENLEMSFRVWQCGGTLETVPCSRVGHVFRAFHPYGMPASSDTHGINTARMAEVWMDDFKELFYLHRPDLRTNPLIGDVTHRKVLREKLHCKPFQWYLDNVYPEKFVPVRDAVAFGRFRNPATGLCLDTLQREKEGAALGVYPCHPELQATQHLMLARDGQLRDEEHCVMLERINRDQGAEADKAKGRRLLMVTCRNSVHPGQKWRHLASLQLQHGSGLCLDAGWDAGADVRARACLPGAPAQRWLVDYSQDNGFRKHRDKPPTEWELKLQKLRGGRRVGRSLMMATTEPPAEPSTTAASSLRHRRAHRKKHRRNRKRGKKNRFILKLVRARSNGSAEHLEVDVHCRHQRLLPNNSFVRDLVALLTDHDIKVINNGRVFERNRVTELAKSALRQAGEPKTPAPPSQPSSSPPRPLNPWAWPAGGKKKKRRRPLSKAKAKDQAKDRKPLAEHQATTPTDAPTVKPSTKSDRLGLGLKRKRKRRPATTASTTPRHKSALRSDTKLVPPPAEASPSAAYGLTSVEDAPMVLSAEHTKRVGGGAVADTRSGDDLEEENHRRYESDDGLHLDIENNEITEEDPPDYKGFHPRAAEEPEPEAEPEGRDPAPLKVVMKSNLTFNLGKEFFRLRAGGSGDHVSDLLNDLANPPSQALPPPDAKGRRAEGEGEGEAGEAAPPGGEGEDEGEGVAPRARKDSRSGSSESDSSAQD